MYFLDQDQSCHWYIIPMDKRKEWEDWNNLGKTSPESEILPKFCKPITHPRNVCFECCYNV